MGARLTITLRAAALRLGAALSIAAIVTPQAAIARASANSIEAASAAALKELYASNPQAVKLGAHAKGIMVFPKIIKGGLVIAGQSGDGTLFVRGKAVGFFNISNASIGLQAGVQGFSYALFMMTDKAIADVGKSRWDVGADPSVVVIDKGAAAELDTTSLKKAVYAVPFDQKGLMAGIALKGSKISKIHPK